MQLNIDKDESQNIRIDRDGTRNDYGSQGFEIGIGNLTLHFEDEVDVVKMAKQILYRMGVTNERPE